MQSWFVRGALQLAADSPWWTQQAWRDERASAFVVSEVLKFAYYVLSPLPDR